MSGSDVCMICYTSGTTGAPKGALITHANLVSVGAVCKAYIDEMSHFGRNDYYISYLPMAHVFEHFMQTACIADGMGIGFSSGDTRHIVDDFKALRPSVFASVPRVLERLIGKVKEAVETWKGEMEGSKKVYLSVVKKLREKGEGFLKSEEERIQRMLGSGSVSKMKKGAFRIRMNVLKAFEAMIGEKAEEEL